MPCSPLVLVTRGMQASAERLRVKAVQEDASRLSVVRVCRLQEKKEPADKPGSVDMRI